MDDEKIVTARDYTLSELKKQSRKAAQKAFVWGMLLGVIVGVLAYWLWSTMI
jgi:hypothetical protein